MRPMYINGDIYPLIITPEQIDGMMDHLRKGISNAWDDVRREPLRKERKPQVDRLPPRAIAALDRIATQGLCHTVDTAATKGELRHIRVIDGKATGTQLLI